MEVSSPVPPELLDNLFEGVYFVSRQRIITCWSSTAAQLSGYQPEEVAGRSCVENLVMYTDKWGHSLCQIDTCPAQKTMADGKVRELPVCYHHREGHMVPAIARFIPDRDERGRITGVVEVFQDRRPVLEAAEKARELEKLALKDPVTGIGNRACAEAHITARLNECKRYGWPFGVLFCDVDKFKHVNDTFGHDVGDRVLRAVSKTLSGNLRTSDFVSRWGGDEFLVVLANVDTETLSRVSEKIRRLVEHCRVSVSGEREEKKIQVTSSIGATLVTPEDDLDSLLHRADQLMYKSKKSGANQVSL